MMSDICYCGSQAGYPHDLNCPFPYYGDDSEMVLRWQRDRNAKIAASLPDGTDLAALRAENAKLREALQDIVQYAQSNLEANHYPIEQVNWRGIQDIARAALASPR